MKVRFALIRLIPMIVLLTGAADFFSFDRFDLFASMSSAAAGADCSVYGIENCSNPDRIDSIPLPDDGCLFCGIGFPAAPIGVEFSLVTVGFRLHFPLIESALLANSTHPPPRNYLS